MTREDIIKLLNSGEVSTELAAEIIMEKASVFGSDKAQKILQMAMSIPHLMQQAIETSIPDLKIKYNIVTLFDKNGIPIKYY